ncbi:MAG: Creatinine amidohydrolase [Phycisphaerae bacterium]|nr:Creatinine amidohydrolase [Phycisphaerae bacterium]
MSRNEPKVRWEELTAPELVEVARTTGGVCLLPIGCLEKHANHLPLGTDSIIAHELAIAAARIEPAVVLPPQDIMGVVNEIKAHPGSISLPSALLFQIWEAVCDEISRNGFHKIVIVNGHGGNRFLLGQFICECMDRRKDYALYWPRSLDDAKFRDALMESDYEAHAGELETSIMMHLRPHACRPDAIGQLDGRPKKNFDLGGDTYTSADWYILHPEHYAGDARTASADKGRRLFEHRAGNLAKVIANIRSDARVGEMLAQFYDQAQSWRNP